MQRRSRCFYSFVIRNHNKEIDRTSQIIGAVSLENMQRHFEHITGFLKKVISTRDVHGDVAAAGYLKIHRGSMCFEDIKKVHEFDRIFVFTSETS
jgi:hypothetical protein